MAKTSFRIKGMCCGEEIGVLRTEIAPLAGGEENLSFDLLDGKMTVSGPVDGPAAERIMAAVSRAGMEAVPWDETCAAGTCAIAEGMWRKHGRLLACALSAVFMLAGLFAQAAWRGSLVAALMGGEAERSGALSFLPIVFYSGSILSGAWFILPKALFSAKKLKPDMNLLMTVAVAGAASLGDWLEAASVAFLFALALLLESWSVGRARRAIKTLMDVAPPRARFICPNDGQVEDGPVDSVPVGASVLVRPGEKVPLDGVVTRGATSVNQAPITGESVPVPKGVGDEVFAGTINAEGAFEFRSTKPASDTTLARIIRMVEEGQSHRAVVEQWVEKFARIYTPVMMLIALGIALLPPLVASGGWERWFYQGLVILVIACPCALVISTPVSIVAGLSSAARNGVLIKGGVYLEVPAALRAVAFDKTGTLTHGEPEVLRVMPVAGHSEDALLANAAALEQHSTHPLARAIMKHVESKGIAPPAADDFVILPGQGAQGTIGGRMFWIGSHRMLESYERESPQFHEMATGIEDAGHSLVVMWCDDHVCGLMAVADRVRPEAGPAIAGLKRLGVEKIVLMTGDNRRTAEQVALSTGVDELRAGMLPEDKVRYITELKQTMGYVAMVGDGVNDAPAMAAATVGIAMGAIGSDAAIETADIALMSDDLTRIPWLIAHSRRTLRVIKQNIYFAVGVKAVFIGLAAAGVATLWGAIAADMGASLLVIFNGLRLLRTNSTAIGPAPAQACAAGCACRKGAG